MNTNSTDTSRRAATGWVIVLTAIGSAMAALDTLVVSTALNAIRLDLGATVEELEWTVNAYNLSFAVLLITAAVLGGRYGRRACYAVGLALFAGASAASALAVTGIAVASGPLVGGAVAEGFAWEWIFWLNVPIGLAAIPFVLARIEESFGGDRGLDLPGLGLITAAALGIVWGLVRGSAAGWGSFEVLGTLAGGLILVGAFIAHATAEADQPVPSRGQEAVR